MESKANSGWYGYTVEKNEKESFIEVVSIDKDDELFHTIKTRLHFLARKKAASQGLPVDNVQLTLCNINMRYDFE